MVWIWDSSPKINKLCAFFSTNIANSKKFIQKFYFFKYYDQTLEVLDMTQYIFQSESIGPSIF